MVQRTRALGIFTQVLTRTGILVGAICIGILTIPVFQELNFSIFNYQRPVGFFGFSLTDSFLAWTLSILFWSGIMYGAIGKKVDYIFIGTIFVLGLLEYFSAENVTPQMYLGLFGAAGAGLLIGFVLKLLRKRIWNK